MNDRTVRFLVEIDESKAAAKRFDRACREFCVDGSNVTPTGLFGHRAGIVRLAPERAEAFKEALGGTIGHRRATVRYCSPTGFFDGSIVSMYETPEDELDGRQSKSYLCHVEHQKRLIEKQNNGYLPRKIDDV